MQRLSEIDPVHWEGSFSDETLSGGWDSGPVFGTTVVNRVQANHR